MKRETKHKSTFLGPRRQRAGRGLTVAITTLLCGAGCGLLALALGVLIGCGSLSSILGKDESRREPTKPEADVDGALEACFIELEVKDDSYSYVNHPEDGVKRIREAMEKVDQAQPIASADHTLASRTWPFPWNRRNHPPSEVAAALTRCRTELPERLAHWQKLNEQYRREDAQRAKQVKDDFAAALAAAGPKRRSVLQLHGLPREYKHGTEWRTDNHWHYGHQTGDTTRGFVFCQIAYFFEGEKLVASNANPANCDNIVMP